MLSRKVHLPPNKNPHRTEIFEKGIHFSEYEMKEPWNFFLIKYFMRTSSESCLSTVEVYRGSFIRLFIITSPRF